MKKNLFILYTIFLIGITVFSYLFIDPNLIYFRRLYSGFAFQNRGETAILYILFILLFFIFYFLFLWLLSKKRLNGKYLRLLIFTIVGILFFSYPAMLSYDIFNYIATAKVLFAYQENPYLVMPIEFIDDPLLSFTHAANKIALYGPFWILLTAIPYFLGVSQFIFTLFSFKLFMVVFYLGASFLIWKITKNIISVSLFSLNPLVIVESLVSAHNDIVMMSFALFSFLLLMNKKIWLGVIFLILSVLIKYSTVFLIPIFIYLSLRILLKQKIDWEKVWVVSAVLMFIAFILSPIREEVYPWYAIWFMPFASIIYPKRRFFIYVSIALSFSLLLRYVPFILLGTHSLPTPTIKILVTLTPVFILFLYMFVKERLWSKAFSL